MVLPDPTTEPTMSVDRASEILGIGRRCAYVECHKWLESGGVAGIPALRFGRAIRVPTAPLLAMIGVDFGQASDPECPVITNDLADTKAITSFIGSMDPSLEIVESEKTRRRADE